MALADSGSVATHNGMYQGGNLQIDVAGRMVQAKGAQAERKAREVLTDERYDEIVDNNTRGDQAWDWLQEAESYFVFATALRRFNLRLTKKGGAVRRTGTVDNENDLMSQGEVAAYADEAYSDATELLEELSDQGDRQARIPIHL